ncbi:MAG: hypothetical protein KJ970_03365 [Candidatus Eisenbacteria bacterium]|uniref:IS66 family insertion sequence element accessory protein TnpB n=1 Tax=Eiseniibacteriota bacterium TaxID=2212470 RepID=A0A948RSA2_UNCEI|nr:hypothetical protein [Candidatus Eisenbacteria bacterium]MBU1949509.1 hypothetical protein [Candidatus Eisenbacteria bacterium]MBU2689940.1 hypothetical protein [Candidatus Eisenbacteria bacterium]
MNRSQEMQLVFKRWQESGLSLRAFGQQEEISYSKLMYWRRRFRNGESHSQEEAKGADSQPDPWVPIHLVSSSKHHDPTPEGYEIQISNGLIVRIVSGFDAVELRWLIMVLAAC